MAIRLGINPIGWSNDDMPELGGETPLAQCLAEARLAGYAGVELGGKFPRQADALALALAAHGLALASGWYGSRLRERSVEAEFDAARPHLALLRALGCDVCVFADVTGTVHTERGVPLSRRPMVPDGAWPDYGAKLNALGRLFAGEGLRLAFHHHMGTVVQSEADIGALMEATDPGMVHLLLDTGHASWGGADPAALAARFRARIAHVHAKDLRPAVREASDRDDRSFLDAVLDGVFTVPGDGAVDYDAVFRAIGPYHGWIVVEAEQDPGRANPLEYARLGHANLRRMLAAAGLEAA